MGRDRPIGLGVAGVFGLLALGCARPGSEVNHVPAKEEATVSIGQQGNAYFTFSDAEVHPDSDGAARGLHVRGQLENSQFAPLGDVVGEGELGQAGSPGWMELRDGSYYGLQTARPPLPPYVDGFMRPDGTFLPSSRTVNY